MSRTNSITPLDEKDFDLISRTAQTAVAVGQVCQYHTDGIKVVPIATGVLLDKACGVAITAGAAGEKVDLVTNGVVDVNVDGTADVLLASRLIVHASTAGALILDGTVAIADQSLNITPLEGQTADAITLTMCKVSFR
jgi:predicted RecA/RadA family phage recombinase